MQDAFEQSQEWQKLPTKPRLSHTDRAKNFTLKFSFTNLGGDTDAGLGLRRRKPASGQDGIDSLCEALGYIYRIRIMTDRIRRHYALDAG